MFALVAYAFITLFTGVALYGHVVLFWRHFLERPIR